VFLDDKFNQSDIVFQVFLFFIVHYFIVVFLLCVQQFAVWPL
jgi:hypothetical protein